MPASGGGAGGLPRPDGRLGRRGAFPPVRCFRPRSRPRVAVTLSRRRRRCWYAGPVDHSRGLACSRPCSSRCSGPPSPAARHLRQLHSSRGLVHRPPRSSAAAPLARLCAWLAGAAGGAGRGDRGRVRMRTRARPAAPVWEAMIALRLRGGHCASGWTVSSARAARQQGWWTVWGALSPCRCRSRCSTARCRELSRTGAPLEGGGAGGPGG